MRNIVRTTGPIASLLLLLATTVAAGCGPDKVERGLAPSNETATPESAAADAETDQQRQQQLENEMQERRVQEFDADAGAKPAQ